MQKVTDEQEKRDEEFIRAWETHGTAAAVKEALGYTDLRNVYRRRRRIETRLGRKLVSNRPEADVWASSRLADIAIEVGDGTAVLFSDAHFWPGHHSDAFLVLLQVLDRIQPEYVIANGDLFDGSMVSRHPVSGWAQRPTVKQELEAVANSLSEIVACSPNSKRIWTRGNHDARIDMRLASAAPEFAGLHGFALADHFPQWQHVMSVTVNNDVMVKHRWHGGIHTAYQNTLKGGRTMVTGHTHTLEARPWADYNGTRYGIQCGTLADPHGPQFDYCENSARNWHSGFVVLTWHEGKLMPPELVHVHNGQAFFRGKVVHA